MKNYNTMLYHASKLISEAFDLDDPMNTETDSITDVQSNNTLEQTYDLDVANPVCPCCGARLNIIDDTTEQIDNNQTDIDAMDPSFEPTLSSYDNEDEYITLDSDLDSDDEESESDNDNSDDDEDSEDDETSGETVEAF